MKKKVSILLIAIIFFTSLATYQISASVKTVYKTVDSFTEASIAAIQARQGFRVIRGGAYSQKTAGEVFTSTLTKDLQEVAMDSYDTISGKKFEATPLKNMPGWSKVVLGAGAFLTSADLVLDVYNSFAGVKESVEILTRPEWIESYYAETGHYPLQHENAGYSLNLFSTGTWVQWLIYYEGVQLSGTYRNGIHINNSYYPDYIPRIDIDVHSPTYHEVWVRFYDMQGNLYTGGNGTFSSGRYYGNQRLATIYENPYPNNLIVSVPAPTSNIVREPIDLDRYLEEYTLIVPNPEHFPDINRAIEENWDMVSNPDEWLRNNPQHDPDAEPVPEPEPVPNPIEIPNPNFDPYQEESLENPLYIPNPNYNPALAPTARPESPYIRNPNYNPAEAPSSLNPPFIPRGSEEGNAKCPRLPDLYGKTTTKFPFSLPFDFFNMLSLIEADPIAPNIDIDTTAPGGLPFKIQHDMSYLDPYIGFFRAFILISFSVFLIMATRNLLGGAQ